MERQKAEKERLIEKVKKEKQKAKGTGKEKKGRSSRKRA